uniref:Uncharacterized protein n=1 Tax=Glossina austeni TaxID=7395 RepID=A0A1A9V8X0_GLOAU
MTNWTTSLQDRTFSWYIKSYYNDDHKRSNEQSDEKERGKIVLQRTDTTRFRTPQCQSNKIHTYIQTRGVFFTFSTTATTLILTMKPFLPLNDWSHRVMEWKVLKLAEIDCLELEKKEELFVAVEMPFVAEQQIAVAQRRPCLKIDSYDNGLGERVDS